MKNELNGYSAPDIEALAVAVEHGFDNSFTVEEWGDGGEESGEAE